MNVTEFKNMLIKDMTPYANCPLFPADENRPKPNSEHVTFKLTVANRKGVGHTDETYFEDADGFKTKQESEILITLSFNAYDKDEDISRDLAMHIYDYFQFYGYEFLSSIGATVAQLTDVTNRDAFIVEEYERRNGFDVIIRIKRIKIKAFGYFDRVEVKPN